MKANTEIGVSCVGGQEHLCDYLDCVACVLGNWRTKGNSRE